MGRVATDICTFLRLREEGFTYVDKSGALYAHDGRIDMVEELPST